MGLIRLICTFVLITLLSSCTDNTGSSANNQESATSTRQAVDTFVVEAEAQAGDLSDLFTYHKKLILNDAITFDVLGIGTTVTGNYLIIKSDKRTGAYASITGDKQGHIVHSYATDMDADQQIEVIIFTRNEDNQQGSLIIHEIDSLNNHTKITLPELTTDLAEGYQGQDTFFVKGNSIIRKFPVAVANSTGNASTKSIEYVLMNNALLPSSQKEQ